MGQQLSPVGVHHAGLALEIFVLKQVLGGHFAEVIPEVFVGVLGPPLRIGVLLFGGVDESHVVDVAGYFAVGEEAA